MLIRGLGAQKTLTFPFTHRTVVTHQRSARTEAPQAAEGAAPPAGQPAHVQGSSRVFMSGAAFQRRVRGFSFHPLE